MKKNGNHIEDEINPLAFARIKTFCDTNINFSTQTVFKMSNNYYLGNFDKLNTKFVIREFKDWSPTMNPKIIAFDADDTLWHNEPHFDEAQERFCELFQDYTSKQEILGLILNHQIQNLPLYGFGVKAFTLSMIETALVLTKETISGKGISKIINIGKDLLEKPIELLPEVEFVLNQLKNKYKLIVATKGDLKDQHRKLHDSHLGTYFHHIEVLSDKTKQDYSKMLQRLDSKPEEIIMVGNSLKSDILPVLNLGGIAIHIPYHTTWEYEKIDFEIQHPHFYCLEKIIDLLPLLENESF